VHTLENANGTVRLDKVLDVLAVLGLALSRPMTPTDPRRLSGAEVYTGNGDAHAKNFSVLERDGEWRVSAAYDTPTTSPYGDTTMALTLNGKRGERIGREDFVAVGDTAGVNRRAVLDGPLTKAASWIGEVADLTFDPRTVHKLQRSIECRGRRLAE
jgi:serine/threonine-protein kinase HipA